MKRLTITVLYLLLSSTLQAGPSVKCPEACNIIPQPATTTFKSGTFTLKATTPIVLNATDPALEYAADLLTRTFTPLFGLEFPITLPQTSPNRKITNKAIVLSLSQTMKAEAYKLNITPREVSIWAGSAAGAFYACQTLLQLCPPNLSTFQDIKAVELPCVTIEDAPAFDMRAMMLDVSRHFYSVDEIKELLDLLAMHKINTFHWHLTDDQGWRIEIKKYPELTRIGSYRPYTTIKRTLTPDNTPHQGYYSQAQIREIINYAAKRFITIIPEIEVPGHATAALASYPWLGCRGTGYKVWCKWGVSKDVYCAGKETTFEFLEDVLREVIALFPSEYIHIGGDECLKDAWKACPLCQSRMSAEGLKSEKELQSYVMHRIERFVRAQGRKIIGWDEIYDGGLSNTATVMSRYGNQRASEVIALGNSVILCPAKHCYFDYYQDDNYEKEPIAHRGGLIPVEVAYQFDPRKDLTNEQLKQVLGVECNLWTEYVPNVKSLQYMLLPRIDAFSEAAWSLAPRNYADFHRRIKIMVKRYEVWGYQYATHIFRSDN